MLGKTKQQKAEPCQYNCKNKEGKINKIDRPNQNITANIMKEKHSMDIVIEKTWHLYYRINIVK